MADAPGSRNRRVEVQHGAQELAGTHVGDRRLRLSRPASPQKITLPPLVVPARTRHPALVFAYGFAGFILAGALILVLPISSASGAWTPFVDALFTATSAVCVTGLVVVDTGTYWSGFGQAVILLLVQAGGFGFMVSSTLLFLLLRRQSTLRERLLLREALGGGGLGSVRRLARRVIAFTLIAEVLGATLLTVRFLSETDAPQALWWGVFHAVSAFNNAGFDLNGEFRSLTIYNQDPVILLGFAALFIVGGISYTVVEDLVRYRGFVRLTLDTKLVLVTTAALIPMGMLLLLFTERSNPETLGAMGTGPQILNAFFHAATPRSAGFNSIPTSQLTENGQFVTMALMFIGGAAGSTAGGIKVQTFSLLFFAILSAVYGASEVQAFRRRVPTAHVLRAVAVALLSLAMVFLVAFALNVTDEEKDFIRVLFEVFSAFSTTGLSTGITPDVSEAGRLIMVATMFVGRLGPLSLVLALAARVRRPTFRWPEEAVKIG